MASAALGSALTVHRWFRTFDQVSLYLAVSRFLREKYIQSGLSSARIIVKSNFAWPVPRRNGPGEYFLYVGRLSPEKGPGILLDAWNHVAAKLLIVGDGPQASELRKRATKNVEFREPVPASEVPALIAGARAVLVPSISFEAAPRSILEACAAGVPVIASRVGSLPEFVMPGVNGLLVSPQIPGEWADAVAEFLKDSVSNRMGAAAWEVWREQYSPERAVVELEHSYQRALAPIT